MTCVPNARLAAAASGEDDPAVAHTRECLRCRALVDEQRELVATVRQLAIPPLPADRRAVLAAHVMARSEQLSPQLMHGFRGRRSTRFAIGAGLVAAAAAGVIAMASRSRGVDMSPALEIATSEQPEVTSSVRGQLQALPPASRPGAVIVGPGADFARDRGTVTLREGALSIDARDREPIDVIAGDTRVTIESSRARVVARGGVIVAAHVFAGSAQVRRAGTLDVIDAGDVWTRPAAVEPPTPSTTASSLDAFRTGWQALRAKRYAEAIAAFDLATDPVVSEDAAFWAALASERAGDRDAATSRLHGFLSHFPASPRVETARAALERMTR